MAEGTDSLLLHIAFRNHHAADRSGDAVMFRGNFGRVLALHFRVAPRGSGAWVQRDSLAWRCFSSARRKQAAALNANADFDDPQNAPPHRRRGPGRNGALPSSRPARPLDALHSLCTVSHNSEIRPVARLEHPQQRRGLRVEQPRVFCAALPETVAICSLAAAKPCISVSKVA